MSTTQRPKVIVVDISPDIIGTIIKFFERVRFGDSPSSYIACGILNFLAFADIVYNYIHEQPAIYNLLAYGFWLLGCIVVINQVNVYAKSGNGGPQEPKKPPLFVVLLIAVIVCLVFPMYLLAKSRVYYYEEEKFKPFRDPSAYVCEKFTQEFLKDPNNSQDTHNKTFFPSLLVHHNLRPICVRLQQPRLEKFRRFWWGLWLSDMSEVLGTSAVILNDNAIEVRAEWIDVRSKWFKKPEGTEKGSGLWAVTRGSVICDNSNSKKVEPILTGIIPDPPLGENYYKLIVKLASEKHSVGRIKVIAMAGAVTKDDLTSITWQLGPDWARATRNPPPDVDPAHLSASLHHYACNKKPSTAQIKARLAKRNG